MSYASASYVIQINTVASYIVIDREKTGKVISISRHRTFEAKHASPRSRGIK